MSDDIPQKAVVKNRGKYDMVDYSKLDVDFIKGLQTQFTSFYITYCMIKTIVFSY